MKLSSRRFFLSVVPDLCKEMHCGGECIYENQHNKFACTCPENFSLNVDGISCVLKQNDIPSSTPYANEISDDIQTSMLENKSKIIDSKTLIEDEYLRSVPTTTQNIVTLGRDENQEKHKTSDSALVEEQSEEHQVTTPISSTINISVDTTSLPPDNILAISTSAEEMSTTNNPTAKLSSTPTNPSAIKTTTASSGAPNLNLTIQRNNPGIDPIAEKDELDESIKIVTIQSTNASGQEIEIFSDDERNDTPKANSEIPLLTEEENGIAEVLLQTPNITTERPAWIQLPLINITSDKEVKISDHETTEPSFSNDKKEEALKVDRPITAEGDNSLEIVEQEISANDENITSASAIDNLQGVPKSTISELVPEVSTSEATPTTVTRTR